MAERITRHAHSHVHHVTTPSDLPGARPAEQITVGFACWSCHAHCEVDLEEIQQDRVKIKYDAVVPNPRKPRKYFIKCSACARFNSVIL
jgi:hypothetical protein